MLSLLGNTIQTNRMDWRAEVTSVSDKVFPGINCKQDTDFGGMLSYLQHTMVYY